MINKSDITVIIPVHIWNDEVNAMFSDAVKSIDSGVRIIISTPNDSGYSYKDKSIKVVKSDNGSSFQHLVNLGVDNVETEWFSVLEFDDTFTPIWFDNFIKYQEYNQQYNIFMPMNDLYNVESGKNEFIGNGNEAVMAASFSDEIGIIDEKCLEDYFTYYLDGSIIKTELYKKIGGLKESIKLTFWYEFMLRAAHNGEKMYVVPKVGYIHNMGREGSLFDTYRKEMDANEPEFWFEQAKKQSFFKTDKNIEYESKNNENESVEN